MYVIKMTAKMMSGAKMIIVIEGSVDKMTSQNACGQMSLAKMILH